MEFTTLDWQDEMDNMLAAFQRQTKYSLGNIKMALKHNSLSFNAKFREYFLEESMNRIKGTYDRFQMDSMFEEQVHRGEKTSTTVQSELGLIIQHQKASGYLMNMSNPIEIVDSSDKETTHIKTEVSARAADELNDAVINGTTRQSTTVIPIADSGAIEMGIASSASELQTKSIQNGENRTDDHEKRLDISYSQQNGGDSKGMKEEEVNKPAKPEMIDDIPLVLVEVNRMFNTSKANLADFGADQRLKVNNDTTKNDNVQKEKNSGAIAKKVAKKSNVGSIDKRPFNTTFKRSQQPSKSCHLKRSNGRKRKMNQCPICDRFIGTNNFSTHMRTHTGEKPYGCDRCGRRFTQSHNLKKHATTHTDDFPYHCESCYRRFLLKTKKEAHEKRCKYRRYECHLCKKSVTHAKSHLKEHMRKHTGEKPFRCEICIKHFGQKICLKRHLDTIHTRINP